MLVTCRAATFIVRMARGGREGGGSARRWWIVVDCDDGLIVIAMMGDSIIVNRMDQNVVMHWKEAHQVARTQPEH